MSEAPAGQAPAGSAPVGSARPLAAVVDGGADDVELVAALAAVAAVTGTGEVGRRLGGRVAEALGATPARDPWTERARSAPAAGDRRTHRWARVTSQRP